MKSRILLAAGLLSAFFLLVPWEFSPPGNISSLKCHAMTSLTEVRILPRITISQKRVSLLDLCDRSGIPDDWQKLMSGADIGEAPTGGAEKYIDPENLRAYLCRFIDSQGVASAKVKIHLPEKIIVDRQSVQLSQDQIETIFRKFVQENAPWNPQDMVVQRISFSGLGVIPAGEMTYEVIPVPRERFVGNVIVTVQFYIDGVKDRSLKVSGKVDVYQNVVHAARALKQNETVASEDIEVQRINIADAPDRYVTQAEQAVNKRLLRGVGVHQPIDLKDLDKPLVLKRGDAVTIVFDEPGLKLTAKGQAREGGATGATVRVNNITSNRTVFCRVVDAQTVLAAH